ncbi:MAG: response regulator [Methanolinea sp.]|jgi:PAS domain S-box-containing protein
MVQKKVMIVEDEGVVALSLKSTLSKMGYAVTGIAITGKEAVKMALDTQPDVILMDIHLKGEMDGIETTAKLNEITDIPVIYLTAYADEETIKRALKTESHSYLVKPFNPRELYSNIEFAIYKRRIREKIGSSREKLELFLIRNADCALIIDLKHRIIFANPASELYTGYTVSEMAGKDIFALLNLAPSRKHKDGDETLQRLLLLDAFHYLAHHALITMKSGRTRTVSLKTGLIKEENAETKNILLLMKDIPPQGPQ